MVDASHRLTFSNGKHVEEIFGLQTLSLNNVVCFVNCTMNKCYLDVKLHMTSIFSIVVIEKIM